MKLFKVIFFVLSIAIVSCKKDAYDPRKISFDELEMVVRVDDEGLDTIRTFENSDFSAALILDEYQRSLQVSEQDHLLRSVIGQEVTFNKTEIGSFDLYFKNLTSSEDELSYLDLYQGDTQFFPGYLCIYNYPFEGINCFKSTK
jgi:hypothetical protein